MNSDIEPSPDPVYRSSLSELRWILFLWAIFFVWVIGYTNLYGYLPPDEPLTTVIGMPSWVFWGVFLPWVVSATVSCWFALTQIQDHPLEELASDNRASDNRASDNPDNGEPEFREPADG